MNHFTSIFDPFSVPPQKKTSQITKLSPAKFGEFYESAMNMWKQGSNGNSKVIMPNMANSDDDDWETDPDFINEMSEEQQRWGGARDTGALE